MRRSYALALLVGLSIGGKAMSSDFDIVLNEIHYNPLNGQSGDEYIELFNRGGRSVDLSGWFFAEGVQFVFPAGTQLGPKQFLVISPDGDRTRATYGIDSVLGDYTGNLANGGENIALYNDDGQVMRRVHYLDGGIWPSRADGGGASLELIDAFGQYDLAQSWAASRFLGGTPGAENSVAVRDDGPSVEDLTLVPENSIWRYFLGEVAFPDEWQSSGFDDSDWLEGEAGIGYGDDDDTTVIEDMEDNFLSIATRLRFSVTEEDLENSDRLSLAVDYDDGFVAYLNGVQVARVGFPGGGSVPFDQEADDNHEAGDFESFFLSSDLLDIGQNVLAFQVHNDDLGSSDLSFRARLTGVKEANADFGNGQSALVINELRPSEGEVAGFVEIYNRGDSDIQLGGHVFQNSTGSEFSLPPQILAPGEYAVFDDGDLGFDLSIDSAAEYALVEADRRTLVDTADPAPPVGLSGASYARFPDGDDDFFISVTPTSGASNQVAFSDDLVISEIMYHPVTVAISELCARNCSDPDQWIEIHNRGDSAVSLLGWDLTKALRFEFPDMEISAGGYLVIASSRERFLENYPGVDPDLVLGDFSRSLSHDSETINLRDPLGNLADHVRYGDGSPTNDEAPDDGIDDRTFLASAWPQDADGSGRTIELIHPDLNNRFGAAWREGAIGGSPAAANDAADPSPAPVVDGVKHEPVIPRPGETVVISCRVSAVGSAVDSVVARWEVDGSNTSGTIELNDSGIDGDAVAGDERWSGELAGQNADDVIAFRVEAVLADGQRTQIPVPPEVDPYEGFDGPYFLFQVLGGGFPDNGSSNYHIVMRQADKDEIESREETDNVMLYASFVGIDPRIGVSSHHLVALRYRGSQTRFDDPKSFRLEFRPEDPFHGIEKLNLNAQETEREILAVDLFRRAGLPAPQEWFVNLNFVGDLRTAYLRKERVDSDFVERWFGGASDHGNIYRGLNPDGSFEADFSYYGEDLEPYRQVYIKRSNREEDDYSDIIDLCRSFDPNETPAEQFAQLIESKIDVDQWTRFFAVQSCLMNDDGGLQTGSGEDYLIYRVPDDSPRRDAGKFVLIPWDVEESLSESREPIFSSTLASIRRLLTSQEFARDYYCQLIDLREGVYSRREIRQRYRLIDRLFSFSAIDSIDADVTARIGFYDENIPRALSTSGAGEAADALIASGADWRFFRGVSEPSGGTLDWIELNFNDEAWEEGAAGFGYDDGDDTTLLLDMEDQYSSLYIRREFDLANPAALAGLELFIDYDDGFIAYLNGVEVARRSIDGDSPQDFDATADDNREAGEFERIDLSEFRDELRAGRNILAIQGLNGTLDSSDFSLHPVLQDATPSQATIGCGGLLYSVGSNVLLTGQSNACETFLVTVDGQEAEYDAFRAQWSIQISLAEGEHSVLVESFDVRGGLLGSEQVTVRVIAEELTLVGGDLTENTVWSEAGGPYLMTADVNVLAGVTLEIQPGVVVFGQERSSLIVQGELRAIGTPASPILFRPIACDNRWGGIAFDDTGTDNGDPTHELRYCSFTYGNTPSGFDGCVTPVGSKLLVRDCFFGQISANAIEGEDGSVEVRDSVFDFMHEGVHCTRSDVIIVGCEFRNMVGDKDAIDFDLNGEDRSLIEGCLFVDGSDDGIDLGDTSVDIINNIFINVQDKALSLEGNGPLGPPTVVGNLIVNSGTAIALKNGVTVTEAHHNTLVGNTEGVNLFAKDNASDGGHAEFHSMIVWNNTVDVKLDEKSSVNFTFSNISQFDWPGVGNISSSPRFVDIAGLDFGLNAGSPCIGTGLDGSDMGAVPFGDVNEVFFVRADADGTETVEITDAIVTLNWLFREPFAADCLDRFDSNDDGAADLSDAVFTLLYLFNGGAEPPPPFPAPGVDPTTDALPCV